MDKKLILKRSHRIRQLKNKKIKSNTKATFETFMTKNGILNNNIIDNNINDNNINGNKGNVKEFFTQNGISFADSKDIQEPKGNLYKFLVSNGIGQGHDTITPIDNTSEEKNALSFLTSNGINLAGANGSETSEQQSETNETNENESTENDYE